MHLTLTIFFGIFACVCWGDSTQKDLSGFDPSTDIISEKYEAGSYLIYDCVEKHWVCVMENFYQECYQKREADIAEKRPVLSCAPIGAFPVKKSCFQRQQYLTTHHHGSRFCIHQDFKEKQIKFIR